MPSRRARKPTASWRATFALAEFLFCEVRWCCHVRHYCRMHQWTQKRCLNESCGRGICAYTLNSVQWSITPGLVLADVSEASLPWPRFACNMCFHFFAFSRKKPTDGLSSPPSELYLGGLRTTFAGLFFFVKILEKKLSTDHPLFTLDIMIIRWYSREVTSDDRKQ